MDRKFKKKWGRSKYEEGKNRKGVGKCEGELAKHRSITTCAECHRKIDPLGFALENFDPIGAWRTEYGKKLPVDASGKLPSGEVFDDIRQLRTLLIERHETFTRSLTEKLMTYALGREVEAGDRPTMIARARHG